MAFYGLTKEQAKKKLVDGGLTVAVYGLGKMGLPLAVVFAEKGARVIGIDANPLVVDSVNKGINTTTREPKLTEMLKRNVKAKRLSATSDAVKAAKQADLLIILVPTLVKDNKPDISVVCGVAEEIALGLRKGSIVVTESTMPPCSTESLIPLLEKSGLKAGKDFGLAHAPERTMSGTALRDILGQYPKVLGALDKKTLEPLTGVYSVINSKGVISASGIRAAECVKVFEGVYRDVNIALANELAMCCERIGVDALEVFKTANTQPFCNIHAPGCGVGGHCIPFYPYFIMSGKTPLLKIARRINDFMPLHTVSLVENALKQAGKEIKGANVLVFGLTFRGGVKEFTNSPSAPIIKELKRRGAVVFAFDPLCVPEDAAQFGALWSEGFRFVDAVVITTDHKEFRELNWKRLLAQMRTKVVVDGRGIIEPEVIKKLGAVYRGIGRAEVGGVKGKKRESAHHNSIEEEDKSIASYM